MFDFPWKILRIFIYTDVLLFPVKVYSCNFFIHFQKLCTFLHYARIARTLHKYVLKI